MVSQGKPHHVVPWLLSPPAIKTLCVWNTSAGDKRHQESSAGTPFFRRQQTETQGASMALDKGMSFGLKRSQAWILFQQLCKLGEVT